MTLRVALLAAALWLACIAGASASGVHAFALVERAVLNKQKLSFVATEVIKIIPTSPNRSIKPAVIAAKIVQDGTLVRLVYLLPAAAARRTVVDNGVILKQWQRDHPLMLVAPSHEPNQTDDLAMLKLLHTNYRCTLLRRAKMNGFLCDLTRVQPRPGHLGITRLLWIEPRHYAILRIEEYDSQGKENYLSYYSSFHFASHLPAAEFQAPPKMKICKMTPPHTCQCAAQNISEKAGFTGRFPAWLPSGYNEIEIQAIVGPQKKRIIMARYSDGLKIISLLEWSGGQGSPSGPRETYLPSGQKSWTFGLPPLQMEVIGDAGLPHKLFAEFIHALAPANALRLRAAFTRDFGESALPALLALRQRGWGFDQIAGYALMRRARREELSPVPVHLQQPSALRESQGRRWVHKTLSAR